MSRFFVNIHYAKTIPVSNFCSKKKMCSMQINTSTPAFMSKSIPKKKKAFMLIFGPTVILVVILFLRVVLGAAIDPMPGDAMGTGEPVVRTFMFILDFLALLDVFAIIICFPIGMVFLFRKEHAEKSESLSGPIGGLAGLGARFLAKLIDTAIVTITAVAAVLLFSSGNEKEITDAPSFWLAYLIVGIVQAYYLTKDGQTIGKKCMKIRIVDLKTRKIGGFVQNVLMRAVLNSLLCFVPLYSFVDIIFIFRDDRRCVHDLMAGTIVVNVGEENAAHAGASVASEKMSGVMKALLIILLSFLVLGIMAILASIIIVAINPSEQLKDAKNAKRRSDINTILNAVSFYGIEHANLGSSQGPEVPVYPGQIPATPQEICRADVTNCSNLVNLNELIGDYVNSLPVDPDCKSLSGTCYMISHDPQWFITVTAPLADGVQLSVTR